MTSSPRLSRRHCLGLATAGLVAPLLQACGGGSSGSAAAALLPQTDPESVRWCREAIQATLSRSDIATTAISVALMADNRVVWREAFGYADRDNGVQATTDTRFNIASVSKVVTALAVMVLRDRGQLALDQPLVELLPAFHMRSDGYTRITVRHLLSHASGVPGSNDRNVVNFVPYPGYAQDTLTALAQSRMKHEPGEMAMYCNDGFTMVEPLVKQLTGLTFPEFVQREIFTPLGMNLSGYALALAAEGTIVHPYYKGQRMPQELPAGYATGGMVSTPTDLLKLARLLLDEGVYEGRGIVSAEAVREMGRDQRARTSIIPDPDSSLWRWGLGWDTVRQPGLDAAGLRAWNKSGAFEYANFSAPLQVLAAADGSLTFRQWGPAGWTVVQERLGMRSDGYWWADGKTSICFRFQTIAGHRYLNQRTLSSNQLYWDEEPIGEWLPPLGSPLPPAWPTRVGSRWACIDESPDSVTGRFGPITAHIDELNALPGYVSLTVTQLPSHAFLHLVQLLRVMDDREAGMTVKIPGSAGRDLYELRVVDTENHEELHTGSWVFRRMAT